MNRIAWIVTIPVAALVVLFALMNRQQVTLSLWPLPWDISAPVFLFTLGAVVFGFLFGAIVTFFSGGHTRQKLREARRALAESQDEVARLKRQSPTLSESPLITRKRPPDLPLTV